MIKKPAYTHTQANTIAAATNKMYTIKNNKMEITTLVTCFLNAADGAVIESSKFFGASG